MRKDGSRFWASVLIDPIHDDDGNFIGFAKITRDMTEQRRAQQELEEARTALFQSQKLQALGELTGGIAHDFNNLMTVIRGSADLLRRGDLSEEKRSRYLDAIIETVRPSRHPDQPPARLQPPPGAQAAGDRPQPSARRDRRGACRGRSAARSR